MTSDKLELSICTYHIGQNVFCISGGWPTDPKHPRVTSVAA